MTDIAKEEKWIALYNEEQKVHRDRVDALIEKAAKANDATEAMKFAQAAVSLVQAVSGKNIHLINSKPMVTDTAQPEVGL